MRSAGGSRTSALLRQASDVSDHGFDLIGLHALAVSGHLTFALLDRTSEFVVAHLGDFGIGKTPYLHALSRGRVALAVRAMACCTFLLVERRAFVIGLGRRAEYDRYSQSAHSWNHFRPPVVSHGVCSSLKRSTGTLWPLSRVRY